MQLVEGPAAEPSEQTLLDILDAGVHGGFEDKGTKIPWDDVRRRVEGVAGFIQTKAEKGDRVAIIGDPSVAWKLWELAVLRAGCVVVAVYPTLARDQIQHILKDSAAKLVVAQKGINVTGALAITDEPTAPFTPVDVGPDDLATVFYTSGTTGIPKGVPLTHRNWTTSTWTNVQGLRLDTLADPSLLAFLPLAHVAGYASLWAMTAMDGWIHFSTPKDMATDFQRVRPTLLLAVPRLYERIVAKVRERVGGGLKAKLFEGAYAAAVDVGRSLEDNGRPGPFLRLRHAFWSALVLKKLRRLLGFDRVGMGLTGSAAVRPEILYFLQGMGINVVEAYGMTETCGLVTSNHFTRFKAGSVGTPMPGSAMAILDDEVLLSGPTIFDGYFGIDEDVFIEAEGQRWLRTGDVGRIDEDGFLYILDRKKELEILDTGKNVAPLRVEEIVKGTSPYIEDVCAVGQGQKFMTALIQPQYDMVIDLLEAVGERVPDSDIVRRPDPTGEVRTVAMARTHLDHPKVQAVFEAAMHQANEILAPFEQVRRFHLVDKNWSVAGGELTPTFKKKRAAITRRDEAALKAMAA